MKLSKNDEARTIEDPFEFLTGLKSGNKRRHQDSEVILTGKDARNAGNFISDSKELDIQEMVRSVIDDKSLVPKDVKVDDGDLPLAKNFYEWVLDDSFAGSVMVPYLEQLIWGVILFAEWCPKCSDVNWLFNTHKVSDTFSTFEDKVTLLENGVCIKCSSTRSYLVKNHGLNFYQELAVNAGQRCVTSDTCVLTSDGLMEIGEYGRNKSIGFTDFKLDVHNGSELEETSAFYVSLPALVSTITLSNGITLRGTADHPVYGANGEFNLLHDIGVSDVIPVYINQQVFGTNTLNLCKYLETHKFTDSFDLKDIPRRVRTSTKEDVCCFLQHLYQTNGFINHEKGTYKVRHLTKYWKLNTQLSAMLNNLGIAHSTYKTVNELGPVYSIDISGMYADRFKLQIGFISRSMTILLNGVCFCEGYQWYDNVEALYSQLDSTLNSVYEYKPALSSLLRSLLTRKNGYLSKSKLKEICTLALSYHKSIKPDVSSFERLLSHTSDDILICSVTKHNRSNTYHETYDFTLPKSHQFITGGILSHNSGKSAAVGGMYTPYLTHKMLKLQKPNAVYGIANSTVLHGTFVALTYAQAKETLWEFYYGTLIESPWFCIMEGTQISLADGTEKAIEDILPNVDEVVTLEGESSVSNLYDNGVRECTELTLCNGYTLSGTQDHKVRCLSEDGTSLIWKNMEDLTEDDFVVVGDDDV